jgi:hypothetical protein
MEACGAVLLLQECVGQGSGILVTDDGDDEPHAAEYRRRFSVHRRLSPSIGGGYSWPVRCGD